MSIWNVDPEEDEDESPFFPAFYDDELERDAWDQQWSDLSYEDDEDLQQEQDT